MDGKEKILSEAVEQILVPKGYESQWEIPQQENKHCVDGLFRTENTLLVAELKVCVPFRQQVFQGFVADAILKLNSYRQEINTDSTQTVLPFVAFLVRNVSGAALKTLREYAELYAPDLCWLLVDVNGRYKLQLRDTREEGRLETGDFPTQAAAKPERRQGPDLFAPKSQWLWKILLLYGFGSAYWTGPNVRPYSVNELAEASGVSQPYVSKFLRRAEQEGYVVRDRGAYKVRNWRQLLDTWSSAVQYRSRDEVIKAGPLYPGISHEGFVEQLKDGLRKAEADPEPGFDAAAGSHFACRLVKAAYSNTQTLQLSLRGSLEAFLRHLDLVRCEDTSDPCATVVIPEAEDAVFKGHGQIDGVPVTDIVQCYVDVRNSRARGVEQADYLFEYIIRPELEANQ